MFNFTPLSGALSDSSASQSLLELDGGVKVLIDVGWDESFDVEKLRNLEKHVPTLSIVLLTHATVDHLAAFAHCCKHFPLFTRIPIYATTPVISLGRTLLQDLYASTPLVSTTIPSSSYSEDSLSYAKSSNENPILLQPPTLEEIGSYFSLIHPLKYSQPHQPLPSPFSPPLNGLTITAYNAGHTLGGTIWHIQHGLESIVYAVDWNQARENILAGAAWLGGAGATGVEVIEQLRKPTALISSSRGAERVALTGGRSKRDELLLETIRSAVKRGGTVLIPTDSSARVLELAYLLEHAWRKESAIADSPLKTAGLYLATKNANTTMRYARSMLEWMDDAIIREFEAVAGGPQKKGGDQTQAAGPMDFRHIQFLERQGQVHKVLNSDEAADRNPMGRVIVASDSSLEWGFSKDVLAKIASDDRNLIIFTERSSNSVGSDSPSLARMLWSWWEERRDGVAVEKSSSGEALEQVYGGGREVVLKTARRVALTGVELSSYQQWLATQRQLQTTLQPGGATGLEASADVVDDASSESSSDSEESDSEQQGKALNMAAALGQANRKKIGMTDEDLGINVLVKKKGVHDWDVRGKKGREKMFPMVIRRKRTDDFGDLIRPEDYLRAEERDEVEGQDLRQGNKNDTEETLGKKRKWGDVNTSKNRQNHDGETKRRNMGHDELAGEDTALETVVDEEEEIEEEVLGPSKLDFFTETITLNLRLAFVDFAGLHDKRSLQMLIPLIQPRKLILVSGMNDETQSLASECQKLLGGSDEKSFDVYTPAINDMVDASVDTNAWAVKLSDGLIKRLRWQNVKGLGIVTLTGKLGASWPETEEETSHKKQKMSEGAATTEVKMEDLASATDLAKPVTTMPLLDVVPTAQASATRSMAQPLHVGDLRLADLRKLMIASGYTAEFRGEGTLLIDATVVVRKMGTGRIEVESIGGSGTARQQAGSTFYAVKAKIYEGLAVVAGG